MSLDCHPSDHARLRRLGEVLFDISAGNIAADRDDLMRRVRPLMMLTRLDLSTDGADEVVDRLLAMADYRLGADALTEMTRIEMKVVRPDGWRRG
jgi:hypothetical protein